MRRSIRKYWLKQKWLRLLIICLVLVLLAGAVALRYQQLAGVLTSQQAAERWAGQSEDSFSQLSCFFPKGGEVDLSWVRNIEQKIEQELTANSYDLSDEERSYYTSAYVGQGEISLTGLRGQTTTQVLGVGGDFFTFHPLRLLSGAYITPDDLMQDRIVLDRLAAWQLFGSNDVAGLTVSIGDTIYYVAGVVDLESDKASTLARGESGLIFMDYQHLANMEIVSGISSYELVMANPVSDFAASVVMEGFNDLGVGVENSLRFDPWTRFKAITTFGQRSMNTDGVAYPYWENAARWTEDHLTLLAPLVPLLLLFPLFVLIRLIVQQIRRLYRHIRQRIHDKQWAEPEPEQTEEPLPPQLAEDDSGIAAVDAEVVGAEAIGMEAVDAEAIAAEQQGYEDFILSGLGDAAQPARPTAEPDTPDEYEAALASIQRTLDQMRQPE